MYTETIAQWNYNTRKVRAGDSASITAENRKEINLNCKIASKKKKKKGEREKQWPKGLSRIYSNAKMILNHKGRHNFLL